MHAGDYLAVAGKARYRVLRKWTSPDKGFTGYNTSYD